MLRTPKFNLIPKFKPRIVHTFVFLEIRWGFLGISNQIFTRLSPKRKIIDFRLKSKTDSHFPEKKIFKTYPMFSVNLVRVIGIQSHFWTGIFLFILAYSSFDNTCVIQNRGALYYNSRWWTYKGSRVPNTTESSSCW